MTGNVAITGIGAVSSVGVGVGEIWEAVLSGRTAFTNVSLDESVFPGLTELFGAPLASDLRDVPAFGRQRLRSLSRESALVARVGSLAWQDAGLDEEPPPREEVGVVLGTGVAGIDGYLRLLSEGLLYGPDQVSPARGPQASFNAAASELSIAAGAEGAVQTVTAGRCSGSNALGIGADQVSTGRLEVALVAAIDTLTPLAAGDGPPEPFFGGQGAVPGEAVVVLVLEDLARAVKRGAPVLAGVGGWSCVRGDDREAAATRAVTDVLGSSPVGVVCSSGCGDGDVDGDVDDVEAAVIRRTLGDVPVFSPFGSLGDCAGVSGLLQVALTARALRTGLVPPTVGGHPAVNVDERLRRADPRDALVLTTDRQGHAAGLLLHATRREL